MKEKFIFIINPKAGKNNNSVSFITKIEAACKAFFLDYEIYITKSAGDAVSYVKEKCKTADRITRFYACGGDGTMNEVINGAYGCPFARVGIIPLGSGNDYIKVFNAGNFLDLPSQINGEELDVDLIKVNNTYVANMCNIGFDANVANNFLKFKSMPGFTGKTAYSVSVFYSLMQKISTPMTITLDDGTEICDDMLLCYISKGMYCGGQYKNSPFAVVNDGFMDICAIKKISRAQFISFFNLYKDGSHIKSPKMKNIVSYQKCKKAVIKGTRNLPICFDGDTAFLNGDITFEVVPKAIKIILPAKSEKIDWIEKETASEIFNKV